MKIFQLIASIFSGVLQFFNNKTLKDAGEDKVKKELLEETVNRVHRAKQIDNTNDSIDVVRQRLQDNADD